MSAEPPSYMNHIHNNGLRGSLSPPMIVITSDAPAQRIHTGRYSEPLSERADGLMDPLMECDEPITISGSRRNHRNHSGRSCTPPPVFRHQNGGVLRPQAFDNRRQEAVHDAEDEIIRRHRVEVCLN
jgi:hypothetical protein